jgi:hypothetical protein
MVVSSTETRKFLLFADGGSDLAFAIMFLVQVDCPYPPSDKVGIISVQRENEEIVPMKAMKMDWVPYVPLEDRYFHATFLYLSFGCIPTFIFSSSQYCIFVHFSLSCSIGSAGLRVWKPKYSLFVAPSEGQFC